MVDSRSRQTSPLSGLSRGSLYVSSTTFDPCHLTSTTVTSPSGKIPLMDAPPVNSSKGSHRDTSDVEYANLLCVPPERASNKQKRLGVTKARPADNGPLIEISTPAI